MNYYPSSHELRTPEALERVLRDLYTRIYDTILTTRKEIKAVSDAIPNTITIPQETRQNLQVGGAAPINVTGLLGKLAEPQMASIPEVTSLPAPDDPFSQDTGVVRYNGTIYVFSTASGAPGSWTALGAVAFALYGTFASRPSVTIADNGKLYFATDYSSLYIVVSGAWVNVTPLPTIVVNTTPYNATFNSPHLLVDATGGNIIINLPAGFNGATLTIKKTDSSANTVTATPAAGKTIDGSATLALLMEGENIIIKSDSSGNWWVL